ncbi:MAG: T9SS type A sorting domain-containing protein [Candidatus Marinimicrobia bacterium]|nr:T9SS type A sorting domain-containing protein [Candidatus Neomarinimicrobiota bacterium]MBL7046165.1 T9SS type A sorting domain-containing protein [Candidatus Neomarinimicrobiota bacterium]
MKSRICLVFLCYSIFVVAQEVSIPAKNCRLRNINNHQLQQTRDLLPEQTLYNIISYTIDVSIDPGDETLEGSVIIEMQANESGVTEIILDAADSLNITSISAENLSNYDHNNHRLHLYFSESLDPDDTISVSIRYHGWTGAGAPWSGGLVYSGGGFFSLNCPYGLSEWVPCKDHPSDKACWLDLKLTVPSQYVVASNGILQEVTDNGNGTFTHHWHESYPIATYLFCINAYPYNPVTEYYHYSEIDSMPIVYYVTGSVPTGFRYVETALPVYSDLFGLYPFVDEKFAIAEVSSYGWAMEHQTCVTTSTTSGMVQVHELAHQWFGDMVTCRTWQHGWLNEGFATYSEALYMEATQGENAYHSYMNGMEFYWDDSKSVFTTDTTSFGSIFDIIIYYKGAWINHMLRYVVGDSVYFASLQDYLNIYAYGNVVTEDLKNVFEDHYGDDLSWFFDQWIYGNGHPHYDYLWASTNDTCYIVIEQSATGTEPDLFKMPVEFQLNLISGDTVTELIWVEDAITNINLPIPVAVDTVILDPDNWVLETSVGFGTSEFSFGNPVITVVDENDDGYVDPGEDFELFVELTNQGIPVGEMTGDLSVDHPGVEIILDEVQFSAAGLSDTTISITPFELHLSEPFDPTYVGFELHLTYQEHSDTVNFDLPLGTPEILLVNMSGELQNSGIYLDVMVDSRQVVRLWDDATEDSLEGLICQYDHILYFTGDNAINPIPENIQDQLALHQDSSNNLLVMGQNIGNVLGSTNFYSDVLQSEYIEEHEGHIIWGNDSHPVIQGENLLINFPADCDVISPLDTAEMAYEYHDDGVAGVISETPGKLLYLGFDLSKVQPSTPISQGPEEFITMILNWFGAGLAIDTEPAGIAMEFALYQNYPNPFNPITKISYQLPQPAFVTLSIYNLTGQLVEKLVSEQKNAGYHTVQWDASQAGSGIYFYRIDAGTFYEVRKCLVIK